MTDSATDGTTDLRHIGTCPKCGAPLWTRTPVGTVPVVEYSCVCRHEPTPSVPVNPWPYCEGPLPNPWPWHRPYNPWHYTICTTTTAPYLHTSGYVSAPNT